MTVSLINKQTAPQARALLHRKSSDNINPTDKTRGGSSQSTRADTSGKKIDLPTALNYFHQINEKASVKFHASLAHQNEVHKAQSILSHVNTLNASELAPNITIKNAVFMDGTKAGLLNIAHAEVNTTKAVEAGTRNAETHQTQVLIMQAADGGTKYFTVNSDGTLGNQLYAGAEINPTSSAVDTLSVQSDNDSNQLTISGIETNSPHTTIALKIDPTHNKVLVETHYDNCDSPAFTQWQSTTPPEQRTTTLWTTLPLLDFNEPAGTNPSLDQSYEYYSKTPEGKLILDREEAFYSPWLVGDETKALFIARAKYNSGEGGIELFAEFMPNRTALLNVNDTKAIAAYDEQYHTILGEIQNESQIGETELPLDPSLQVIIASGLAEAFAQSPQRVNDLLTDIDSGWTVQYDYAVGGQYSVSQNPMQSANASITFKLDSLLHSYALTNDTYNLIAHEAAHSLDGQGSVNLDGLPSLSADDTYIFKFIRAEVFKQYYQSLAVDPSNPETFGLGEYAFTNHTEFWAEISGFFLSGDAGAQTILALSPELHDILSRYYNVD